MVAKGPSGLAVVLSHQSGRIRMNGYPCVNLLTFAKQDPCHISDMVVILCSGTVQLGFDVRTHSVAKLQVVVFYGYVHGFN